MGPWQRTGMALVGFAILSVYVAAAFGLFLVMQWLVRNPPDPLTVGLALVIAIFVAGLVAHRLGSLRLLASLDVHRLSRDRAPQVYLRLDRLTATMRVDSPPILVADLGAPNALSIGGPRKGAIVLDRQLLDFLTVDELEGILAHELAHLESHHTFVNTVVVTAMRVLIGLLVVAFLPFVLLLAGVDRSAAWFSGRPRRRFGLILLFKYSVTVFLGMILLLFALGFFAYSRQQEYAADSRAADVTGNPEALARALGKIHRANRPRSGLLSLLVVHDERRRDETHVLSTHPPIDERIDRLLERVDHRGTSHRVGQLRPY